MKRFNFDRYDGARLMAEGVAVHAETMVEAVIKANALANSSYSRGWRLKFSDNHPCPSAFNDPANRNYCPDCYPSKLLIG